MEEFTAILELADKAIWLLIIIGAILAIVLGFVKCLPKNADPAKRSVLTILGTPVRFPFRGLVGPFKLSIVGYEEVPYEFQVKVPATKMMSKEANPIEMRVEDMSFTLRVSKKSPVTFLNTGGEEFVKKEALGMVIAGLQEFAANSNRTSVELKKAQPYMLAAIVNYVAKGDLVDLNNEGSIKQMHDLMASKNGSIEIPSLGVTLVQMDIGRIVEPQAIIDANVEIAEQEAANAKAMKKIKGVTERLKELKQVDPSATLETLQIQEGIRPADERKITVSGVGEADRMIAGIIAALENVGGGKQQKQSKTK